MLHYYSPEQYMPSIAVFEISPASRYDLRLPYELFALRLATPSTHGPRNDVASPLATVTLPMRAAMRSLPATLYSHI